MVGSIFVFKGRSEIQAPLFPALGKRDQNLAWLANCLQPTILLLFDREKIAFAEIEAIFMPPVATGSRR
jgi:hypothetical protein